MISGGYETECCQVYFVARRNALEETLRGKLGYEGHSIDDVQKMSWEIVEREISTWIAAFNHCATVLFSCERKLSDAVFNDCPQLSTSSEAIFNNLSGGLVIQFLIFPEAVAMTKRSAEKLFKFLDLYETMRDHLPTAYDNFPPDYVNELKAEAALTRGRLGEGMVGIFSELENSIQSDSSKTPVPGGAVHPLSRYTMNYLKLAGDYKETLEQVFREHQKIERADSATGSDFDYNSQPVESYKPPTAPKQSPFELQIRKVMEILELNLESKSKIYNNLSLCSIFMMNNGRYILQKVRGSPPINQLMGDQWLRKQSQELRQYHKTYQRETWGRLLQCLSIEGLLTSHGKVNKPVLKERFKSFNLMFDEIHRTQSTWVISDEQLLSELRISISSMVIPAYRSFLARYSQIFTPGRQTEKYIKFQEDDIETYIDELFDGKK
nr:exocyst complex component EXO70B1 [Ipomoea batatas]